MASDRHLGIGFEGSYGGGATPTVFFEFASENLQDEPTFEEIKVVRGFSTREVAENVAMVRGQVEVFFDFETMGYLLYWFFGIAPDTTGAGPYVHTFPPSTGLAADGRIGVSACIEVNRKYESWRYQGAKLVGLGLQATTDGIMRATLDIVAKDEDVVTAAASPSYLAFNNAKVKDLHVMVNAAEQKARSFSWNANWPVDTPNGLGSERFLLEPDDEDVLACAGSFENYFVDTTVYGLFANRTLCDLQFDANAGAAKRLILNMNQSKLTKATPPMEGRSRIMQPVEWISIFDTAATENVQAVLTNSVAAIPA